VTRGGERRERWHGELRGAAEEQVHFRFQISNFRFQEPQGVIAFAFSASPRLRVQRVSPRNDRERLTRHR
jgi:hypothetical protein